MQALSSYVFIAANIILHASEAVQCRHLEELLPPVVPLLTSHHHSLRGFTQVLSIYLANATVLFFGYFFFIFCHYVVFWNSLTFDMLIIFAVTGLPSSFQIISSTGL